MASITVRVTPSAGRNRIVRCEAGVWHIHVRAPPEKGKANRELVDFITGILAIPRSAVVIERGLTSRTKVLKISGLTEQQVALRLAAD